MTQPDVIVDGQRLSALTPWGDLEWVTCWPGGTESITFGVERWHPALRPDALVELEYGGSRVAVGALVDPTPGDSVTAEGLHRKGEEYPALTAGGDMTTDPNEAVDVAIADGLPWLKDALSVLDPLVAPIDADSGPLSLARLLDHWAATVGQHWGIAPDRNLIRAGKRPATLHMLPGVHGLGISREGYASILIGRFLNSFDSVYYPARREDTAASARWGRVRRTINQPLGNGAAMSSAEAWAILDGLLAQGRAEIGWTTSLEVQQGDVVNEHGQAVDLNPVAAGQTIRLHGLDLDVTDLSGRNWDDVQLARTHHKGATVLIEFAGLSQPMNDALAGVA